MDAKVQAVVLPHVQERTLEVWRSCRTIRKAGELGKAREARLHKPQVQMTES